MIRELRKEFDCQGNINSRGVHQRLNQAWKNYSTTMVDAGVWLAETPEASLVVPHLDAKIVQEVSPEMLHTVAQEVENVARSSKTGRALFSSVLKKIAHYKLVQTVTNWLGGLTQAELDGQKIAKALADVELLVGSIEGIDELEEKREYSMHYRGAELKIVLKHPVQLADKMLRVTLRECGALAGQLTLLPGEVGLSPNASNPTLRFKPSEYRQADRARQTLISTVTENARGEKPTGDDVKERSLTKPSPRLEKCRI
eukprot:6492450-Amphidinium_carterae.1